MVLDCDAKTLHVYRIENSEHKLVADWSRLELHANGMHWGAEILMDDLDHVQINSSPFYPVRAAAAAEGEQEVEGAGPTRSGGTTNPS